MPCINDINRDVSDLVKTGIPVRDAMFLRPGMVVARDEIEVETEKQHPYDATHIHHLEVFAIENIPYIDHRLKMIINRPGYFRTAVKKDSGRYVCSGKITAENPATMKSDISLERGEVLYLVKPNEGLGKFLEDQILNTVWLRVHGGQRNDETRKRAIVLKEMCDFVKTINPAYVTTAEAAEGHYQAHLAELRKFDNINRQS